MAEIPILGAQPEETPEPTADAAVVAGPAYEVGPCEATFNQMMAEVNAQMRRAHLAATRPEQKPQVDVIALLKGMMRGIDAVLAAQLGGVYEELERVQAEVLRAIGDADRAADPRAE